MSVSVYDPVPDVGYLYDHIPLYQQRGDARFYAEEAARSGGPVLELGCGTGRVLLPIARAGTTIVGLDGSRVMLERLRDKLAAEPAGVRGLVEVVEGDARQFELGRTFPLITAPFRVLQHMVAAQDQLALLASVARHLAPGGRFVFDLFNPRYDLLVTDRSGLNLDTPELTMADGRTVSRAASVKRVRWVDQVSEVEIVYFVAERPGAPAREHRQAFEMRWYTPSEVEHLAARAGFRVAERYGDFSRGPLEDGAPEQVYCLVRA